MARSAQTAGAVRSHYCRHGRFGHGIFSIRGCDIAFSALAAIEPVERANSSDLGTRER